MDRGLIEFAKDAIRGYLRERPGVADTLEGIHRWWIHWPAHPESQVVTEVALEQLEAEGVLERFRIGDSIVWRGRRSDD